MLGDSEIVNISESRLIDLPKFIKLNSDNTVYFRSDFFNNNIIILDYESIEKILNKLDELKEKGIFSSKNYVELCRFIFPSIIESKCDKNRKAKFPFKAESTSFICSEEEDNLFFKIKKFVLKPVEDIK